MKNLILLITVLLFSNQIANAQYGAGRTNNVTEFYPKRTQIEVPVVDTIMSHSRGTTKIEKIRHIKEIRNDVTTAWWESWFSKKKPKVLFDYWGCEECSDSEAGFIVLKKGNTSVVLFNFGGVPYAIFNAKIFKNELDYKKKLNPAMYAPTIEEEKAILRESKAKHFQSLKAEFGSDVVALTTKKLEFYFK